MVNSKEKKETINKIAKLMKEINCVNGIVLVGSSANGLDDKYSDIDMSIVLSNNCNCLETWKKINTIIVREFSPIFLYENIYSEDNYLSLIFLENYLEIDMGVTSLKLLIPKKPNWEVIFDRNGEVKKKMEMTDRNPDKSSKSDISEHLVNILYHTRNFCVALNRKKELRAAKEIEDLRNNLIELIGENQNIVVKHYRDVDGMNNDIKKDLKGCYLTSFEKTSLDRTYRNILNMYFAQIEMGFPKNSEINRIRNYVNNMLKEFCEVSRLD